MVAAQQHLGHREIAPHGRLGVAGVLEQAVLVALLGQALRVADHARNQAPDRLDHRHRRHLPAVEHVVADAELANLRALRVVLDDALVDSLVATAGEDEVLTGASSRITDCP